MKFNLRLFINISMFALLLMMIFRAPTIVGDSRPMMISITTRNCTRVFYATRIRRFPTAYQIVDIHGDVAIYPAKNVVEIVCLRQKQVEPKPNTTDKRHASRKVE